MNRVGHEGANPSGWWFLCCVVTDFAPVAEAEATQHAANLAQCT
jgi:hypothetical protein